MKEKKKGFFSKSTTFTKNALKSSKSLSKDLMNDLMPNLSATVNDNTTYVKERYTKVQTTLKEKRPGQSIKDNSKETIRNLLKDLKSGNFYNSEAQEKAQMEAFGMDMEAFDEFDSLFNDEDSDEDTSSNDSNSNNIFIEESNNDNLADATIESSVAIIKTSSEGFSSVTSILNNIMEFHNDKTVSFYNEMSEKITGIGNSVARLEKVMAASAESQLKALTKTEEAIMNNMQSTSLSIRDMAENLKNNSSGGFGDLIKMMVGSQLKAFKANPLGTILKGAMKGVLDHIIPPKVKNSLGAIDKLFGDMPSIFRLFGKNAKKKGGLFGLLGDLIVKATGGDVKKNKDKVSFGKKDMKEATSFDVETKTTINRVIPMYLSKILASVSNDEFYKNGVTYDMENGVMVSSKDYQKKREQELSDSAINTSASKEVMSIMKDTLKEQFQGVSSDISEFLKQMVDKDVTNIEEMKGFTNNKDLQKTLEKLFRDNPKLLNDVVDAGKINYNKKKESLSNDNGLAQTSYGEMRDSNSYLKPQEKKLTQEEQKEKERKEKLEKLKSKSKLGKYQDERKKVGNFSAVDKALEKIYGLAINGPSKDILEKIGLGELDLTDFSFSEKPNTQIKPNISNKNISNSTIQNSNIETPSESSNLVSNPISQSTSNTSSSILGTSTSFDSFASDNLSYLSTITDVVSEMSMTIAPAISEGFSHLYEYLTTGNISEKQSGDYSGLTNTFSKVKTKVSGIASGMKKKFSGNSLKKFFKTNRFKKKKKDTSKYDEDVANRDKSKEEAEKDRDEQSARTGAFSQKISELWGKAKDLGSGLMSGDILKKIPIIGSMFNQKTIDKFGGMVSKGVHGVGNLAKKGIKTGFNLADKGLDRIGSWGDQLSSQSGLAGKVGKGISFASNKLSGSGMKIANKVKGWFSKDDESSATGSGGGMNVDLSVVPDGVTPVWIIGRGNKSYVKSKASSEGSEVSEKDDTAEQEKNMKKEEIKEKANEIKDRLKQRKDEFKQKATEIKERGKQWMLDKKEKIKERAKNASTTIKERAKDLAAKAKERLLDAQANAGRRTLESTVSTGSAVADASAETTKTTAEVESAIPIGGKAAAIATAAIGAVTVGAIIAKIVSAVKSAKADKNGVIKSKKTKFNAKNDKSSSKASKKAEKEAKKQEKAQAKAQKKEEKKKKREERKEKLKNGLSSVGSKLTSGLKTGAKIAGGIALASNPLGRLVLSGLLGKKALEKLKDKKAEKEEKAEAKHQNKLDIQKTGGKSFFSGSGTIKNVKAVWLVGADDKVYEKIKESSSSSSSNNSSDSSIFSSSYLTSGSSNSSSSGGTTSGSSNSSSSGGTISGSTTSEQVMNYLLSAGYSKAATAGIMGNLKQESSLNPKSNSNDGAHGIAQWEGGRFSNLKKYASSKGTEWTDLQTQLEFLDKELNYDDINSRMKGTIASSNLIAAGLNSSDGMSFSNFKALSNSSSNAEKAARLFEAAFERAGKPMMTNRVKYAKEFFNTASQKGGGKKDNSVTLSNWLSNYSEGKYAGAQCAGWVSKYLTKQYGQNPGGNGLDLAKNTINTFPEYYSEARDLIDQTGFKAGDIVSTGGSQAKYGHVFIVTKDSTLKKISGVDSNWNGDSKVHFFNDSSRINGYPSNSASSHGKIYNVARLNTSISDTDLSKINSLSDSSSDSSSSSSSDSSSDSSSSSSSDSIFSAAHIKLSDEQKQALLDDQVSKAQASYAKIYGDETSTDSSSSSSSSSATSKSSTSSSSSSSSTTKSSSSSSSKSSSTKSSSSSSSATSKNKSSKSSNSSSKNTSSSSSNNSTCKCNNKETYDYEKYYKLKEILVECRRISKYSEKNTELLESLYKEIKKISKYTKEIDNKTVKQESSTNENNEEKDKFNLDPSGLDLIFKGY